MARAASRLIDAVQFKGEYALRIAELAVSGQQVCYLSPCLVQIFLGKTHFGGGDGNDIHRSLPQSLCRIEIA